MTGSMAEDEENVKVAVRCRPLSLQETRGGHQSAVDVDRDGNTVSVSSGRQSVSARRPADLDRLQDVVKTFTFDHVFDWNCDQITIYNRVARPIVNNVLKGYNGAFLRVTHCV